MFELKLARMLGALAFGSLCAGMLLASCTTPNFAFVDADAGSPVIPHCQNAQRDEGESDVDCGGVCAPCALTQSCNTASDCKDGDCTDGTCQAAGCNDGAKTGNETDVDCGGGSCKACVVSAACVQGPDCQSGVCDKQACATPTCNDRVTNGSETDIDCGGPDCSACIAGQSCLTPSDCVGNDCTSGKCALSCAAGMANCDGDPKNGCETNIRTDGEHCGDCATVCSLSNASATCTAGVCHVDACTAPFADCNGDPKDGCEINTKTDLANCGSCDSKPCPALNGSAYCADSACGITCTKNFADCDGQAGNGCEKDVSRDTNNCGGCGTVCKAGAGKTAWCRDGQCGETTCATGRGDCNGDPDDDAANGGCETDFKTDLHNCGACGTLCGIAGGTAQCSNGTCAIKTCDAGLADCTGGYADGCETNTNTDIANCGTCAKPCTTAGGTPQCTAGMCQIKSCASPNFDCNATVADGCEVNLSTNSTHCGSCSGAGSNCSTAFASAAGHCANSACVFDGCGADHLDCNLSLTDGCEVNYKTDKNHCGNCGTSCSTTGASSTSCNAGTCVPVCTGTFLMCSNPQNGCAVNSATDPNNCGGCTKVCSTAASAHVTANGCSASTCQPTCVSGYANCDSNPLNGCELPVSGDVNNCGGCNVVCGTSAHTTALGCTSGSCTPTCQSGWKNCGTAAQGCNTQLGTVTNCLSCGDNCGAGFCTASGCSGHLDIAVGGKANYSASFNTGVPAITKSHTLSFASGNNRIVIVGVTAPDPFNGTDQSVKYNGTSMIAGPTATEGENNSWTGIFYLLDSSLPSAAGAYPVTVTFTNNQYVGNGAFDIIEFKNVQQSGTGPFVTTASNGTNNDCSTGDRTVTLAFSQAGSWGYAITGAREGDSATPNPGFMVPTMNQIIVPQPPYAAVAGYGGPTNGPATFQWTISNCWNSAGVGVALKRVGD